VVRGQHRDAPGVGGEVQRPRARVAALRLGAEAAAARFVAAPEALAELATGLGATGAYRTFLARSGARAHSGLTGRLRRRSSAMMAWRMKLLRSTPLRYRELSRPRNSS